MRNKKNFYMKRVWGIILILMAAILLVGCGSQQNFGQRKAPRNCHTCTKWSK